jgi:hypothetical protein
MNDELEYLMWQYVDNKLSDDKKNDFIQQLNDNPIARQKLEDIQAVHHQLQNLPVSSPDIALGNIIMNEITNSEINAQIQSETNKDKSLIPIILILFGGLIVAALIITYFTTKSGDLPMVSPDLPISTKALTSIGYLGILVTSLLILYKISFTRKKV